MQQTVICPNCEPSGFRTNPGTVTEKELVLSCRHGVKALNCPRCNKFYNLLELLLSDVILPVDYYKDEKMGTFFETVEFVLDKTALSNEMRDIYMQKLKTFSDWLVQKGVLSKKVCKCFFLCFFVG